jgi:uncharacterized protein YukE
MTPPTGLPTSADIEAMQRAEPIFQTALDAVTTSYQKMLVQQETLQANWVGETASAFGAALSSYLEDLVKIQSALKDLMSNMGVNTGIYANTQETNQQVAQAFTQTVNSGAFSGLPGLSLGG